MGVAEVWWTDKVGEGALAATTKKARKLLKRWRACEKERGKEGGKTPNARDHVLVTNTKAWTGGGSIADGWQEVVV